MSITTSFDINCRQCPRLVTYLNAVKEQWPTYYCKPVPAFGQEDAKLLIVGLAPGLHGANRTGRPFTGDASGELLYQTLYQYGFSNQSTAISANDHLQLINCRITNAVKCLPPSNKPNAMEIETCNHFLAKEIGVLDENSVILTLGVVAHKAVLKALGLKLIDFQFKHAAWHDLPNRIKMVNSYHCSRYNTQTKRLTSDMFNQLFFEIQSTLANANQAHKQAC
jgi:uracil-DNA glycosylase family 4